MKKDEEFDVMEQLRLAKGLSQEQMAKHIKTCIVCGVANTLESIRKERKERGLKEISHDDVGESLLGLAISQKIRRFNSREEAIKGFPGLAGEIFIETANEIAEARERLDEVPLSSVKVMEVKSVDELIAMLSGTEKRH